MKKFLDIRSWFEDPVKRMWLVRIGYLIALVMTVLGGILIVLSYIYPGMVL